MFSSIAIVRVAVLGYFICGGNRVWGEPVRSTAFWEDIAEASGIGNERSGGLFSDWLKRSGFRTPLLAALSGLVECAMNVGVLSHESRLMIGHLYRMTVDALCYRSEDTLE